MLRLKAARVALGLTLFTLPFAEVSCTAPDDGQTHTTVIEPTKTTGADGGNSNASDAATSDAASATDADLEDSAAPRDVLDWVRSLPNVGSVAEFKDADDATRKRVPAGYRRIDFTVDQPVDHAHPEGQHFNQRVSLLHRSFSAPMVLASTGYQLSTGRSELTVGFEANQIQVEHRYFASSTPSPVDWTKLTVKQSADDFHEIVRTLKPAYRGKWVSTGASKGGETAVFFRRFYPGDVDATVAYVAPLVFGLQDPRFPPFIDAIGGASLDTCRAKLRAFQRALLQKRSEILPMIRGSYARLGGTDVAFEHGVIETTFGFFQYGDPADAQSGCGTVPPATASAAELYDFFESLGALEGSIDDAALAEFEAYSVQAAHELGNYGMDLAPLADLLTHASTYTSSSYLPPGVSVTFVPETMRDIDQWVKASGERIMFIYGEYDPWTAAAYDLGSAKDSFRFTVPAGNHGSFVGALPQPDQAKAQETLERWFGRPVALARTPSLPAPPSLSDAPASGPAGAFSNIVSEEERPVVRRRL